MYYNLEHICYTTFLYTKNCLAHNGCDNFNKWFGNHIILFVLHSKEKHLDNIRFVISVWKLVIRQTVSKQTLTFFSKSSTHKLHQNFLHVPSLSVVSLNPIKGSLWARNCTLIAKHWLVPGTDYRVWVHSQTKINWRSYCRLTFMSNKLPHFIKCKQNNNETRYFINLLRC